jgi:RPA family protein
MEHIERVFAQDFSAARHTADSRDGRDGSYVVTPTGAWCRSLFIVGAVTERRGSGDLVQARVADPTGTFRVTADWQSPDTVETLGYIEPPAFVAVTGRAVLTGSGPRAQAAVEAEALCAVDRTVRDLWVLETAGATLDRLEALRDGNDERTATALRLYRLRKSRSARWRGWCGRRLKVSGPISPSARSCPSPGATSSFPRSRRKAVCGESVSTTPSPRECGPASPHGKHVRHLKNSLPPENATSPHRAWSN